MKPLTKAGIILGLGLGGFVDGIVFHQILGWHHMICVTETCQVDTVDALRTQVRQDGYFHAAVWLVTVAGIALLFCAARTAERSWESRKLVGGMLSGWGIFNVVEGLNNHQVLGIHHVLPGSRYELLADAAFLGLGLILIFGGWVLAHQPSASTEGVQGRAPSVR